MTLNRVGRDKSSNLIIWSKSMPPLTHSVSLINYSPWKQLTTM